MDLKEIRKWSETLNEHVARAEASESVLTPSVELRAIEASDIADALNYAANEIERERGGREMACSSIAAARLALGVMGDESLVDTAIRVSSELTIARAEIATLRSMLPTLRDGDAKPKAYVDADGAAARLVQYRCAALPALLSSPSDAYGEMSRGALRKTIADGAEEWAHAMLAAERPVTSCG